MILEKELYATKQTMTEGHEPLVLKYFIISQKVECDHGDMMLYGVEVEKDSSESCCVSNVTNDFNYICFVIRSLSNANVTPIAVAEILDDFTQ